MFVNRNPVNGFNNEPVIMTLGGLLTCMSQCSFDLLNFKEPIDPEQMHKQIDWCKQGVI